MTKISDRSLSLRLMALTSSHVFDFELRIVYGIRFSLRLESGCNFHNLVMTLIILINYTLIQSLNQFAPTDVYFTKMTLIGRQRVIQTHIFNKRCT